MRYNHLFLWALGIFWYKTDIHEQGKDNNWIRIYFFNVLVLRLYLSLFCCLACVYMCVWMLSYVWLCDPMVCNLPGSSVHGILQASILEQVTISISRVSSQSRDQTHISCTSCIGRLNFTTEPLGKSHMRWFLTLKKKKCCISLKGKLERKFIDFALLTMPKPLTVWITINCGKFWKRWEYQTTWPDSWETCMQVRKQLLELDMEQQTGSK